MRMDRLSNAATLLPVHSDSSEETSRAENIFQRAGATDVSATGEEKVMDKAA
jgi:hypothetical protein